jgi:hypothetical protein
MDQFFSKAIMVVRIWLSANSSSLAPSCDQPMSGGDCRLLR